MNKPKVLFSIPTQHHVEIALDEMEGLQELGYTCGQFTYAAKDGYTSAAGRLWIILRNAFRLVKICYQFKPNVIYFNSRLEALAGIRDFITILIVKLFYLPKTAFAIKSHGSDIDVLYVKSAFISKIIMPFLKRSVDAWLFLSAEEANLVTKDGHLLPDKVFVTKNIVRTGQFKISSSFKNNLSIPDDHQILLFVGRIIKEKGIYEVIEAFSKFTLKHKAVLIVVGDGADMENVRRLSSKLSINDKVIFTGFIAEQKVIDFYANSDILVFPTFFPEGFPMALFNSIAAGLGIITTPTRAAKDYLTEPYNCLWVEPQDSHSVYNALNRLVRSETLLRQMKKNNRHTSDKFTKKQVSIELAAILNRISERLCL